MGGGLIRHQHQQLASIHTASGTQGKTGSASGSRFGLKRVFVYEFGVLGEIRDGFKLLSRLQA